MNFLSRVFSLSRILFWENKIYSQKFLEFFFVFFLFYNDKTLKQVNKINFNTILLYYKNMSRQDVKLFQRFEQIHYALHIRNLSLI